MYVGAGTRSTANNGPTNPAHPSGLLAGDNLLLVDVVTVPRSSVAVTDPGAGWEPLGSFVGTVRTDSTTNGRLRLSLWTRTHATGQNPPTVAYSGSGGDAHYSRIFAVRGQEVTALGQVVTTAASTQQVGPIPGVAVPDSGMVLAVAACSNNVAGEGATTTVPALAGDADWSRAEEFTYTSAVEDTSVIVQVGDNPDGQVEAKTFDIAAGNTVQAVALMLSLAPVEVAAPIGRSTVLVTGLPVTAAIEDTSVRAGIGAAAVEVRGLPVTVHKEVALPVGRVEVGPAAVDAARHVDLPAGQVEVRGLPVVIAGTDLRAGRVAVRGLPLTVSYGVDVSASRRVLPPLLLPSATRIIAQSILSGRFLDMDLPLLAPEVTLALSGATQITGRFAPEIGSLTELGLDAWATWLHVEDDGVIRGSGILLPTVLDPADGSLTVDAIGPSGYAARIPYRGSYSEIGVDPADVMRHIWAHIQGYPRGNLGVTVRGSTPVRLGTEPAEEVSGYTTGAGTEVDSYTRGGPYTLSWWDDKLCGKEIDDLASEAPFDYIERCAWNADKTDVEHWIDLAHPRIGRRLFDARFAQGENILEHSTIEEPEDAYADEVFVHGKGEGATTVIGRAAVSVGDRLRLPAVISDATADTDPRARARAADELAARLASLVEVSEVVVDVRHDNALLGTFAPGDEALIELHDLPYYGDYKAWSRITTLRLLINREVAVLGLSRAGEFATR